MAHEKNTKGQEIEVKKFTPVALTEVPDGIDFAQDIVEFGGNYSPTQLAMPFLTILQPLSHEVTRGDDRYVQGAQPGMFFNTVTKEFFDGEKGIKLIYGNFKASYIEWVPRSSGGGFVSEYTEEAGAFAKIAYDINKQPIIQEGSPVGTPGNVLNLTHTRMAFLVNDDLTSWAPVIVSMSSSQIRASRELNMVHSVLEYINPVTGKLAKKPPMPYVVWKATTKISKNDQGSWFSWNIEKAGFVKDFPGGWNLYTDAREFVRSSRGQKAMQEAIQASPSQSTVTIDNGEIPF